MRMSPSWYTAWFPARFLSSTHRSAWEKDQTKKVQGQLNSIESLIPQIQ